MNRRALAVATALALVAFAANSVLCRLALGGHAVDAASFTSVRIASGAIVLYVLMRATRQARPASRSGWRAAGALFAYAACFSFAYGSLTTAMGALILFGSVQLTMLLVALGNGERLSPAAWFGFSVAAAGLVVLVFPGLSAPSPFGALLMGIAGAAWGAYTLLGRGSEAPVADTARNVLLATPMALLVSAFTLRHAAVTPTGIVLAVVSGAVTSGLGYTLWYAALRSLSATQAAVLQLLVPMLAALGGVMFVSELPSWRLAFASCMILGGVAVVITRR